MREKNSYDFQSLRDEKPFISDISSSPKHEENAEGTEKSNLIDIKEIKKAQIELLDKNSNLITDNLENKIVSDLEDNQISLIVTTKTNEFNNDVISFENLGGVVQNIWDDPDDIIYGFSGKIYASKIKEFSEETKSSIELIEENLPAIRNSDVATHLAMIRTHVWDDLNY
ncbi:MAG: hypothetical protein ACFFDC_17210, partial [Promethearchaeota archaeon]